MFSMPPATATLMLMLSRAISCAAETMACAPEPHTRLTVSAGPVTGSPAWTAACRAGFILVPACTTLPMTPVSTSSARIPARPTAAPIATAPRLGAGTSLRLPPKVPIAVRTGSAKTTERCDVMADLLMWSPTCVGRLEGSCVPRLRSGVVADPAAPAFELPSVIERVMLHEFLGGAQALDTKAPCHGHLVLRRVGDELGHTGARAAEAEARRHVQSDETTHLSFSNCQQVYMH